MVFSGVKVAGLYKLARMVVISKGVRWDDLFSFTIDTIL
jgi:hypothetical protein